MVKRKRRFSGSAAVFCAIIVLAAGAVLAARSAFVSDALRSALFSRVEEATGLRVDAGRIVLNLLPLYVEARDVKVFESEGRLLSEAERIKGYLSLWGLSRRKILIQRVLVVKPRVWMEAEQVSRLRGLLSGPVAEHSASLPVGIVGAIIKGGEFSYSDSEREIVIVATGLDAEVAVRDAAETELSVARLSASVGGRREVSAAVSSRLHIRPDSVLFEELNVRALGSNVSARGSLMQDLRGALDLRAHVLVESVKEMVGLSGPGEGEIMASGSLKVSPDWRQSEVDLELTGAFYLDTLMELVHAPEGYLRGYAEFSGRLWGSVTDITGQGRASMKEGAFFGISVGETTCRVSYMDGLLAFGDGRAELYGGRAEVEVSLSLPHLEFYSVGVDFSNAAVGPALALIGLQELTLPPGVVSGRLSTSGGSFEPAGWIQYTASGPGEGPLGRVESVTGSYWSKGKNLHLEGFKANTETTNLAFDGLIGRETGGLEFSGLLDTNDLGDMVSFLHPNVTGKGRILASVTGNTKKPYVRGLVELEDVTYRGYHLGSVEGDMSYAKERVELDLRAFEQAGREIRAVGAVTFPETRDLLAFAGAGFDLDVSLRGAEAAFLAELAGKPEELSGRVDAVVRLQGTAKPSATGSATWRKASVEGFPLGTVSASFSYGERKVAVTDGLVERGKSRLSFAAHVDQEGKMSITAQSDRMLLADIISHDLPVEYVMSVSVEGRGTVNMPDVHVSAQLMEGRYHGASIGGGKAEAVLTGKSLAFDLSLLDGKVAVSGGADLVDDIPWSAELVLEQGRYGFLLVPFMKTVPDDFLVSANGGAFLEGTRDHFRADVAMDGVNLNLYGQGFSNDAEVRVTVNDRNLEVSSFSLQSGTTYVNLSGSADVGSSVDLTIDGSSSLSPLAVLTDRIEGLRGEAEFVFRVYGPWERPSVTGGVSLADGSLVVQGTPQRLSDVNGYVYVYQDRAVIERLSATLGGGTVSMSGIMDLSGFSPKRVYLDTAWEKVTWRIRKGFFVTLGGTLLFRRTEEAQDITGEVFIERATYRERIEWKSWLLEARRQRVTADDELPWMKSVGLNVRVSGDEDIIVENNVARAEVTVDLIARGTLAAPRFFGRVSFKQGKVFFRNSQFSVLSASADYSDEAINDPYVSISAQATVKGYDVLLNLEGKLQELDLSLVSEPALDEVQILGLLTYGEFGSGLSGLEGGIGAAEATSFLTGKQQDLIEERLTEITGLDRITIDPYVSSSSGKVAPRMSVSKELLSDRLFVTYATTGEEQELNMEYLLNRNVSLLGGRDEHGGAGGDIKFRFTFK